jgi:integrase
MLAGFQRPLARPRTPDAVAHRFLRLQRCAGTYQEDHGWHRVRHTLCTYAAELYPLPNLQDWLGHQDIQTTMRSVPRTLPGDFPRVARGREIRHVGAARGAHLPSLAGEARAPPR